MLISECLGNDKDVLELHNAIRHFVKTMTICRDRSDDLLVVEPKFLRDEEKAMYF